MSNLRTVSCDRCLRNFEEKYTHFNSFFGLNFCLECKKKSSNLSKKTFQDYKVGNISPEDFLKALHITNAYRIQEFLNSLNQTIPNYTEDFRMSKIISITNTLIKHHNLTSKSRKPDMVWKRHMIFWWLYTNTNYSYREIGKFFTNDKGKPLDHATVLHGVKEVQFCIEKGTDIAKLKFIKDTIDCYNGLQSKTMKNIDKLG